MGQTGFFDLERRLDALSAKGDPLETIKTTVPWETFRADIEAVTETKPEERKSNAGRKPYDAILKFKIVVLQSLYNLSDEQTEFMIRDRLSFMRFLDLRLEDTVPDATTLWLFREALVEAKLIDTLFDRFGQHLAAKGYIARGGQIVDATIVSAPKQRNTREENNTVKNGDTPEDWEKKPAKGRQKDKDARSTKKHRKRFSGYKIHVDVDKAHKLIHKWDATDACPHDSQKLDDMLDPTNTSKEVSANSAYRSAEIEQRVKEKGFGRRFQWRVARDRTISQTQEAANTVRSKVRDHVEHVFGHQEDSIGRKIVRTIGMARARSRVGMMNLGCGIRRLVQLARLAAAPACVRVRGGCVLRRVNQHRRSMRGIKASACPSPQLDPEITATPEAMENDIVRGCALAWGIVVASRRAACAQVSDVSAVNFCSGSEIPVEFPSVIGEERTFRGRVREKECQELP